MIVRNLWTHKIRAFLSTPPIVSLLPGNEERADELTREALGPQPDNIDHINNIKAVAEGFDIPPFVKKFQPNIFFENPVFKHPLSGVEIKLNLNITTDDGDKTQELIKKAIAEIRDEITSQKTEGLSEEEFYKRLFLALWRKLPDVIRKKESETGDIKVGSYWDWLPADPRIPTHSVWEHSSIVSAIAGTNSNPALLIFTFASPQLFIASARRTQDSWMGSFLYSFLMWEAIKYIADQFGPDCFLFPDLRRQPLVDKWLTEHKGISLFSNYEESAFQIANFPNMLTTVLPFEDAADAAREAHQKMKRKWEKVAEIIGEKVEFAINKKLGVKDIENWKRIWDRQIKDFLNQNIFWVVCPWQNEGQDVLAVYHQLFPKEGRSKKRIDEFEQLLKTVQPEKRNPGMMYQSLSSIASRALTARKNLRDFQNHNKEEGEKCSLCGIREALHPDSKPDGPARYRQQRVFWQDLGNIEEFTIEDEKAKTFHEKAKFVGRIKRGDALCAVCLVKRLALDFYFNKKRGNGFKFDRHLFPSTSTIATAPFKAEIIDWCFKNPSQIAILRNYNRAIETFLKRIKLYYPASAVPKLENKLNTFNGRNKEIIREFLRLDGQWLIKESFYSVEHESNKKISGNPQLEELRDEAVKSLDQLLEVFKKQSKLAKPSSYYAVISMDGDKIGDWLNGMNAPSIESLFHPDIAKEIKKDSALKSLLENKRPLGAISHLSLSIILKNFALEIAPRIIERENYGKLIFAGGDDLLAFVPIENLLGVIEKLHRFLQGEKSESDNKDFTAENGVVRLKKSYSQGSEILVAGTKPVKENTKLMAGKRKDEGCQLTASFGVAIIHHSYPLPQAIEEAVTKAMKNTAKEKLGRNAVAFHLHKRSGTALKVGFKFDGFPASETALSVLASLLEFMKDGSLSSRIAYAMCERSSGLSGKWTELTLTTRNPWWHDAQKCALRHLVSRRARKSAISKIESNLISLLEILYKSYRKPFDEAELSKKNEAKNELDKKETDTGWNTLIELLLLLRFLAGEEGEGEA